MFFARRLGHAELCRRPLPDFVEHLHHAIDLGRREQPLRPLRPDVEERRLIETAGLHHAVGRQLGNHQVDELDLVRRSLGAGDRRGRAASPTVVQSQVHTLDGHRVTLDVHPAVGLLRGAAILSHGFTRSLRTLAGHAQALADAGVLALTPNLPCTFHFRCNARALAALTRSLRAGGTFGAPVDRVMLVGFSAGGLSSLLAADTPGVVGFVGLDPFDRTMPGEAERLGLAAAGRLRTAALLLRAPQSRCNAEAVTAPWGIVLPALWRDELVAGASHCDFESPTDWVCCLACGDADPARQQQVRQGLLDAAARWLR